MTEIVPVRIDKFLWAVRIFKTRGLAASACHMGRILINEQPARPSKTLQGNELLTIKKPPVTFSYRIRKLTGNRLPAKMVPEYLEDLTPESEKEKTELSRGGSFYYRKKGSGRPTKKERRMIDKISDDFSDI
ncbi:MAG: RNA-binding S4 domain-containing protein [Bacteroidales bacterium]|nr:RNA-binding S4 domain-containing protein [Bacteroidales bacterium]